MRESSVRILMIDDHVMVLQAIKNLLATVAPHLVIDATDHLGTAVEMVATTPYSVVLLDWNLRECEGKAAMERLRAAGCMARIVVLSGETKTAEIRKIIELEVAGFIPKRHSSETMLAALAVIVDGGIYFPPEAMRDVTARRSDHPAGDLIEVDKRFAELTPRQVDVYRAAMRGLPNKLIARQLGIAESTVKTHLAVVYAVLGVHSRTEAAFQAWREGFRVD